MNNIPQRSEIAIIGAGVVGLVCALRLADLGHEVTLIAPQDDESGASYGNAGVIADYAVMPVGTPQVLRNLPDLLLNRDSPLALHKSALLTLAPWLLRFVRESLPGRARANARAIAGLLASSAQEWRDLADRIDGKQHLKAHGSLYLFETETDQRSADFRQSRALGVEVELLSRAELGQLEPHLPASVGVGAAFFPRTLTVDDPRGLLRLLRAAVSAAHVQHVPARVTGLEVTKNRVLLQTDSAQFAADKVILAAGAWSKQLARQAGARVPLDTERGYHLEYDMPAPILTRQMTPMARGFYFCPMAGRLRVAGTVELGGLTAPASPHRWTVLERGARAIFPDLPAPDRRWMGCRPSIPDSRPVIGQMHPGDRVIHAYGHGHLGLTLAPVTAAIIADLVAGRQGCTATFPDRGRLDLAAYAPGRF